LGLRDLGGSDPPTEDRRVRAAKGSHLLLRHPETGKEVWIAVYTKKDAGQLGNRILREAGVK
jgi:predicted RNA binding protein YcfA (HicA-like mRNA interferase family)